MIKLSKKKKKPSAFEIASLIINALIAVGTLITAFKD